MSSSFNSPKGPYVETYTSIIGKSVVFVKNDNNKLQAEVELILLFKQDSNIVRFSKYIIKSPEIIDTNEVKPNFINQQRIAIENGKYNIELLAIDKNNNKDTIKLNNNIIIDYTDDKLQFSDIQLVERHETTKEENILSKNGFDLYPYVSDFYPQNLNNLCFYLEIYNSDKIIKDDFIIRYYIETFESQQIISAISRFKRLKSASITPCVCNLNINDLASGNYYLVAELISPSNEKLLLTKFFFQRSNASSIENSKISSDIINYDISTSFEGNMLNRDSLIEYISCLYPLADAQERSFIDKQLKIASLDILQNYFINFWKKRDNISPGTSWRLYREQVIFVNNNYGTLVNKGYMSDRGRVYLQYGAPNKIYSSKHEPSAYPYEIWTYHRVRSENNKKFVFYNPNIAGKDYELLHSNLSGEIRTPNWERYLNKRNNTLYNQDLNTSDEVWGSRALEEFNKK